MTVEDKTVVGIKAQPSKFSGIISKRFNKPKKTLIKEVLYGIQASKDVKLSNISRTLKEDQTLIKTEDRLSRNLDDEDFQIRQALPAKSSDRILIDLCKLFRLGWSHYRLLLSQNDPLKRKFYFEQTGTLMTQNQRQR